MTVTFAYDIMGLTSDTGTGVVLSVEFGIRAELENGASSRGLCDVVDLAPPGDSFIQLDALTAADVAGWIEEQLNPDKLKWLKRHAEECLAQASNPKVITTLPWRSGD